MHHIEPAIEGAIKATRTRYEAELEAVDAILAELEPPGVA
jgi:hypothetical protein